MGTKTNPAALWLTYPLTWLVLAIIIASHVLFSLWFSPSLIMHGAALGVDAAGLIIWFIIALKSKQFQSKLNRMPYEDKEKNARKILRECPPAFRTPALESLDLIAKINADFQSSQYEEDLALMTVNLLNLAKNHQQLYKRYQHFGTTEQKASMKTLLEKQIGSMNSTLKTLKTFGGNLTLLDAGSDQPVSDELKFINQGLKEVIQEFEND